MYFIQIQWNLWEVSVSGKKDCTSSHYISLQKLAKNKGWECPIVFWLCNPMSLTLFAGCVYSTEALCLEACQSRGSAYWILSTQWKKDSQLWEDSVWDLHAGKLKILQWVLLHHGYKQVNCLAIPYTHSVREWFFCQCSGLLHELCILAAWCSPPSKYATWTLCYIVRNHPNFNLKTQQAYHLFILWRAVKSSILSSTTDKATNLLKSKNPRMLVYSCTFMIYSSGCKLL